MIVQLIKTARCVRTAGFLHGKDKFVLDKRELLGYAIYVAYM